MLHHDTCTVQWPGLCSVLFLVFVKFIQFMTTACILTYQVQLLFFGVHTSQYINFVFHSTQVQIFNYDDRVLHKIIVRRAHENNPHKRTHTHTHTNYNNLFLCSIIEINSNDGSD